VAIRPLRVDDTVAAQAIERRAGARFRDVGLAAVADDDPFGDEELAAYAAAGRGWAATDERDRPVGYVVVDIVDGNAHVEQISVDPDHQSQGLGRGLLDEVQAWARRQGMNSLTLTTFRDVEWNAPLYEHLGFVVMNQGEIGPELAALVRDEAHHGLDPSIRVCMRLTLE
jgi:GNAT superfamily N-acetyltransferase